MALLFIVITPLVASLLSLFTRKSLRFLNFIAIGASLFELLASALVMSSVVHNGVFNVSSYLSVDPLGVVVMMLVAIVGSMVSWYSVGYLKAEVEKKIIGFHRVRQYFVLFHLFLMAMFFASITTNPILMWIAIEATTLSTAFLISFYNKPSSMEAAWKYLIVNSVGLLLGFFGTLLFLYPTIHSGIHGFISWQALLSHVSSLDPFIAKIAFVFVLIGFGTKVGLVPMHTWLPDAYSKAPAPISSLLSGVLLNVAFLAILRFKLIADIAVGASFSQNILIFFGIASLLSASFVIFGQSNYKRLLAYSSIEHIGILALGFGFGGMGAFAALLHMIYNSLAKSIMFLSAGNIFLKYSSTKIKNIRGMLSVLPITSILFIIGFLTLTGIPPFGIFLTEFSIVAAGIQTFPAVVILVIFTLILAFVGFLKHVSSMVFGENEQSILKGESSLWTTFPIIIMAILLIFLSFYIPSDVRLLLHSATINY